MVSIGIMVQYWTDISQYCPHGVGIVSGISDLEPRIVRLSQYCQKELVLSDIPSIVISTIFCQIDPLLSLTPRIV
jgi:hypothetical protein